MSETHIYLIRHGATTANDQRPYVLQGNSADHPLNETGRRQAAALGQFMADKQIDHIYSSPMKRAVETAQAVIDAHQGSLELRTIPEIYEVDVGDWEGMGWDAVMETYPDEYRAFMDDPGDSRYLNGESYRDVLARVRPALLNVAGQHFGETIAVVAHQVVNRSLLADLMKISLKDARGIRQANTGINIIRHRPDETEVLTVNASFHLSDVS